jgi:NADP-dependent 3-hydroxy acid dehydrogenase YdfG
MERVVAITGASPGIGRATALRLAADGASLAICARRRGRLDDVAREIARAGGKAMPFEADVTSEAEMTAFVGRAIEHFGHLDVMMCNAGFGLYGAIDQVASDRIRRIMDVNYHGTVFAIRAALPAFRRQQRGHIVIVSSIVGKRGVPYMAAYSATKFAQVGLAESLRAELTGTGIHVTTVCPISTETEFFEVTAKESGFRSEARGPRQQASDVANAIARVLDHPAPEVYPYRMSRGLVLLTAIAPGFSDRLVKKWGRKPVH